MSLPALPACRPPPPPPQSPGGGLRALRVPIVHLQTIPSPSRVEGKDLPSLLVYARPASTSVRAVERKGGVGGSPRPFPPSNCRRRTSSCMSSSTSRRRASWRASWAAPMPACSGARLASPASCQPPRAPLPLPLLQQARQQPRQSRGRPSRQPAAPCRSPTSCRACLPPSRRGCAAGLCSRTSSRGGRCRRRRCGRCACAAETGRWRPCATRWARERSGCRSAAITAIHLALRPPPPTTARHGRVRRDAQACEPPRRAAALARSARGRRRRVVLVARCDVGVSLGEA